MSHVTIEIYKIFYVMNYCNKIGYKGMYKKSIGRYNIAVKNVTKTSKLDFLSTETGTIPKITVKGFFPIKCEITGKFVNDGIDIDKKIIDDSNKYYPPLLSEIKVNNPVNVLMPGMGIRISNNAGFLYDLPDGSEWIITSFRTERQVPNGNLTFKLSLSLYPLEDIECKLDNPVEEEDE